LIKSAPETRSFDLRDSVALEMFTQFPAFPQGAIIARTAGFQHTFLQIEESPRSRSAV
jgi:hypothetical protein